MKKFIGDFDSIFELKIIFDMTHKISNFPSVLWSMNMNVYLINKCHFSPYMLYDIVAADNCWLQNTTAYIPAYDNRVEVQITPEESSILPVGEYLFKTQHGDSKCSYYVNVHGNQSTILSTTTQSYTPTDQNQNSLGTWCSVANFEFFKILKLALL